MTTKRDRLKTDSLARVMRVGLLGSPYDWGQLDFETWKAAGVELTLTAFPGTTEANRQDLLLRLDEENTTPKGAIQFLQNEFAGLECQVAKSDVSQLGCKAIQNCLSQSLEIVNDQTLSYLKQHEDKYVGTDTIIAKYATEALRVGSILDQRQVHIENDALAYLIEAPWRNCNEIEYVVCRMFFYLDGDILRKSYVQEFVYELGTSIRGISNSSVAKSIVRSFSYDILNRFSMQKLFQLLKISLEPYSLKVSHVRDTRRRSGQRKDAA